MPKLLVIADDLTGANDVGVQFAGQGIPTLVRPDSSKGFEESSIWPDDPEVLVVSTESRHVDAATAAQRVRKAVELGAATGAEYYYKKTDSTLRGNIGSELEALLGATGSYVLPFIPAVPQLGRTTVGGRQYVDGRALDKTAFAADPIDPIESSSIPMIIAGQSRAPVEIIGLSRLSQLSQLSQMGERQGAELKAGICVFDAATDDDLLRIGVWLQSRHLLGVVAGAAGFAGMLPKLIDFSGRSSTLRRPAGWRGERMLVINGSLNEASLAQIERARSDGFEVFTLPAGAIVPEDGAESAESARAIDEIIGSRAGGRDVILRSIGHGDSLARCLEIGARLGLKPREVPLRVAANIGRIVSRIVPKTDFKVVAVFGGDTLAAIVRALGWRGLRPQGEIVPGVVASGIDGEDELLLLTKAGGFGPPDLLKQVRDFIG